MLRFYQPLPAKALISLSHIYSWSISQPFSVQLPYHLIVPMGMLSHFANPSVISLLLFYLTSFSNTCTYVPLILTVTSFLTYALSDSQVLIVSWCYNYPLFVAVTSISHDYLSELIIRPDMMIRLSPTQNLTVCCPVCNLNSFPNYVMGWGVFLAGTNEWSGLLMHYALCFSVSPTWCTSQNKNHSDRLQLWQVLLMLILEKRQRLWVWEIYWGEPRRENSRPTFLMSHPSSSSPSSPSRFEITLSLFSSVVWRLFSLHWCKMAMLFTKTSHRRQGGRKDAVTTYYHKSFSQRPSPHPHGTCQRPRVPHCCSLTG